MRMTRIAVGELDALAVAGQAARTVSGGVRLD
jgi:hypothetical protein